MSALGSEKNSGAASDGPSREAARGAGRRALAGCAALFCLAASLWVGPAWGAAFVSFPTSWDVGQAFAVSITSDADYDTPTVTWLKRTVSLDVEPGGDGRISYALLGSYVRDVKPGEYPILFEFTQGGQRFHVKGKVALRARKYPQERLRVSPKMVSPPKGELARIKREAALAARAKGTMTVPRKWTTPAQKPLDMMKVTSSYGFQRVYNGTPRGYHAGTDLRSAVGTAVRAPFAGTVVLVGDHYYAGGSVYVDSGNGVVSVFFHLNESLVKVGQRVARGQVVGRSGRSGRVTGPHLHYGLCLAGQYVDPMPLFETSVTQLLKRAGRAKVAD